MISLIISFALGIIVGVYFTRKFVSKLELDTDICIQYLKDRGYTIRLYTKSERLNENVK